ncbi:twin-arginine translocase subunit TatB [Lysobacter sp. TY2-98]|uniref:Sec-independent protein translocase protein TatB n=1 Tax=Lysobacter sp. TY2-98 TaxID=2290922 RepID=UPI000E206D5C|nr:Sec-independent protein translocase protein TatB [Lysobacter sp. TY2-98]AXK73137.1 twin-arginine translocase subunit TatB [Lysobacter sp. TY2-98]
MFDVGFSELLLTALVALIVLGPERLPKAARLAGMWIRRARAQWQAVKNELETELADEEMRRSILRARDEMREAQDSLRAQLADVEARMTRVPGAPEPQATADADADAASSLEAQLADAEAAMTAPSTDSPTPPEPNEQR